MEEGNINFFLSENEKIESSIVSESDIDLSQFINDNDIHHIGYLDLFKSFFLIL